jgi:hypothetical protein
MKKKTTTHPTTTTATKPKTPIEAIDKNIQWPERKGRETRSRMVTRPLRSDVVKRLKKKTDSLNRDKKEKPGDDSSA